MTAACKMLVTYRISQGWNVPDRDDLEIQARIWIDILDRSGIPADAYMPLYHLASDARAKALRDGKQTDFTAELLVSLWSGPNGLRAEREHENAIKRLPAGECPRCNGSGFEPHTVDRYAGVRRCSCR